MAESSYLDPLQRHLSEWVNWICAIIILPILKRAIATQQTMPLQLYQCLTYATIYARHQLGITFRHIGGSRSFIWTPSPSPRQKYKACISGSPPPVSIRADPPPSNKNTASRWLPASPALCRLHHRHLLASALTRRPPSSPSPSTSRLHLLHLPPLSCCLHHHHGG